MNRRQFLATAGLSALGGCLRLQESPQSAGTTSTPADTPTSTAPNPGSPTTTRTSPDGSPTTLSEVWRQDVAVDLYNHLAPAVATGDAVVIGAGGTLRAFARTDGRELWSHATGADRIVDIASRDGTLYGLTTGGRLTAINRADGTVAWESTVEYGGGGEIATGPNSLLVATHRVSSEDRSQIALVDPASGNERWTITHEQLEARYDGDFTHGIVHGTAPVVDGLGVVSFTNQLYGCDITDGTIAWTSQERMHGDNYASMSIRRKMLIVPSYTLVGLNVETGERRWRNADDVVFGRLVTTPVVAGDAIYAGSDDNGVYKFAPDGAKQWRYQTDNAVHCDPVVAGGVVWVGSDDGSLYGLDPASGTATVVQRIGSPVVWATASRDRVVCATENGLRAYRRDG